MTRICADSIVVRGEKPTIDGESSPALPAKAVHAVKPSNNHYSILSDNDSPQVGETIDVQPEKQLEEPREKPVFAVQTITVTEDEPREGTDDDAAVKTNTLPVPTSDSQDIWEGEVKVADLTNPKKCGRCTCNGNNTGTSPNSHTCPRCPCLQLIREIFGKKRSG